MVNVQTDIPMGIPRSNHTLYDSIFRVFVNCFGWLIFYLVSGWLSKLFIPKVRLLKPKEQMFWGLYIVVAAGGIITPWAAYLMFVDKRLSIDHTLASTNESWAFTSAVTGFFVFEELAMIYFDLRYRTFSLELHLHHVFALIGFGFPVFFNFCHYYAAQIFLLQVGTPFSCICWCLLKLNYQQTKIWKVNQWILIYAYHSRTFCELWSWYTYYQDWEDIKQNLPWLYTTAVFLGIGIMTVWLTPYWTYKKTAQFFSPIDWECKNERKHRE